MVWSLIIVSENKLQWSHLPSFSYSLLPIIKVEETLSGNAKFQTT